MAPRYFQTPEEEKRVAQMLERRQLVRQQVDTSPEFAASVANVRRQTGSGLASLPLAKAGVKPEQLPRVAAANLKRKAKKDNGIGARIGSVMRGTARTALTVLESPLQELTGLAGDLAASGMVGGAAAGAGTGAAAGAAIGSIVPGAGTAAGALVGAGVGAVGGAFASTKVEGEADFGFNSTGAIAAGTLARGERVSLGTGYFSGGEVRKEHTRRANEVQVGGKAFTGGRHLAASVLEPGSTPFKIASGLLDASVAIKGDPGALVLGDVGKARRAAKAFIPDESVIGMVRGRRNTTLPEMVDQFIDSNDDLIGALAAEPSAFKLSKMVKDKLPTKLLVALADESDPTIIKDILRESLGSAVRNKPTLASAPEIRRSLNGVRLLQQMPGSVWHLDDVDQAVRQTENVARNAKLPLEKTAELTERMMRADTRNAKFGVITDTLAEVSSHISGTIPAARAKQMTRIWQDHHDEFSKYFTNEVGENMPVLGAAIAGNNYTLPSPHILSEFVGEVVPSPNARDIRRVTSRIGRVMENPAIDVPLSLLDWAQQEMWKPMNLIRFAWPVRVIGELQARMAASDLDSLGNHPMRAVAWMVGRKGATAPTGEVYDMADEASDFAKSLTYKKTDSRWRDKIIVNHRAVYHRDRDVDAYATAWQDELGMMVNDPISRVVAGGVPPGAMSASPSGNNVLDAKEWGWNGRGQAFRKELADADNSGVLDVRNRADGTTYWDDYQVKSWDDYIDSVHHRMKIKTGDDQSLIDLIATGRMNGQHWRDKSIQTDLVALVANGVGPETVQGVSTVAAGGSKASKYLDRTIDTLFSAIMSKPESVMGRSPAFRQLTYNRLGELVSFMDDTAKSAAIAAAKANGVRPGVIARMERTAAKGADGLTLEEATTLAHAYALDESKRLLYDFTQKSQFADVTRLMFPFAEAWKEILTSWAKIGTANPQVARRAQQIVEGARGSGFFSTDDATGEEVFTYPFSEWINKTVTGVPVPFQGRVEGLNLFSAGPIFIPGFGPAVQVPVSAFLPDTPDADWVREVVLPFGEEDLEGGVVESFMPPWFQKFRQAGVLSRQDERLYGNTVMDISRYLVSTGEYSLDTPEEQERLTAAAKQKAKSLYVLRGMAQFFSPSPPSPKFLAKDKDGRVTTAFKLAEDFRALQDADYDSAPTKFLELYGDEALLYMQPKSRGGFSPTDELHEFVRANPKAASRYKDVYGYFAPTGGEFSFAELERQLAVGDKEGLKPEEAAKLANGRVASMKYRQARDAVGARPDAAQRAWLRDFKDALLEDYPGWEPGVFKLGEVESQIRQLEAAVKDPSLATTDAGEAIGKYLKARKQAVAAAQAGGYASFGRPKSTRYLREWLRDYAEALTEDYPTFAAVYDRVFDREMIDDVEEPDVEAEAV